MKPCLSIATAILLAAGAGAQPVPAGCPEPELSLQPGEAAAHVAPAALTVVSLNLAKQTGEARIADELRAAGLLERADVFSLQEVRRGESGGSVAERLARLLGMHAAVAGAGAGRGGANTDGVALLSRYPLTDTAAIRLPLNELGINTRCRVALAATIGQIRVVGLHLDTRVNVESRLAQFEPALQAAAAFDGPAILAGDFNTNSFFWIEHLIPLPFVNDQAEAVFRHLAERGFHSPFSPGGQATNDFLGLQLDWVFLRGLEAGAWGVEPLDFTDHHAVWVGTQDRQDVTTAARR